MAPRHILKLSASEQRQFLDSFDLIISDCDGVIWLLVGWIPGAGEAINALKGAGKTVKFVSNNSFRTDAEYMEKFAYIGAQDVRMREDVVHPVKTMVHYLKQHRPGQRVHSLMSLEANETLDTNGIDYETLLTKKHITANSLIEHLTASSPKPVGAVLFDINLDLSYLQLAKAVHLLQQSEDCELIAGGSDVIMPLAENLNVPGFLDFVEHLTRYTKREPTFLSKPSPILGDMLKQMYKITEPKRCLFIGDMLVQDVQFGNSCGFQSLLVLSGSMTKRDMEQAAPEAQPDFYADSLADFLPLLQNIQKL